jgi:predicted TIM-barrel fold metal-dependent hydrolase
VKSSQILFGTDFPPGGSATDYVKALSEMTLLNKNDLKAIDRDNAVRLIPRLGRV